MTEESFFNVLKKSLPQVLCVISATFSTISDGMQYGWSAPIIPILREDDSPIKLTRSQETWLETIYMIGGVAGLPITIYLVDKIGRKYTILGGSCLSLTGWILISFANSFEVIMVARTLTGIAADVAFVSIPMYIAEIAHKTIRGFLAGMIYLMMLLGILVIYSIGPFVPIWASSSVGICIIIVQLVSFSFMPESPYFLIGKEKHEKARSALLHLRSDKDIDKELEEITAAVKRQRSEKGRPQDLILVKSNRKAFIIMTVLNASQHFSSISVLLMNIHHILNEANSTYVSGTTAGIIFAALMLIAAFIADLYIDEFGRKILLTTSSLLTGLSLLVLAIYFSLQKSGMNVDSISWLPIASIMLYAVVFKYGLGMVPIIMTAELFPAKMKAIGMTVADFMYVMFSILSIELYEILGQKYGLDAPFYLFSLSCIATALFSLLYIPETKGKTLDEIQFILKGETGTGPLENGKNEDVGGKKGVINESFTSIEQL